MWLKFLNNHCSSGKLDEVKDFSDKPTQAKQLIDLGHAEEVKAPKQKPERVKPTEVTKAKKREKKVVKPKETK